MCFFEIHGDLIMLEFKEVVVGYKKTRIIDGVNLTLSKGEAVTIVGKMVPVNRLF